MRRFPGILFLLLVLVSCKKEPADFIWERSFGKGVAYSVSSTADSGFIACGTINNKPYFTKLSRKEEIITDYTSGRTGVFTSVWSDTACFVASGNASGKMLIECVDNSGKQRWDTTFTASFRIESAALLYSGKGAFVAIGSAYADSSASTGKGLLFVNFDTTGKIIFKKEIYDAGFVASGSPAMDNSGNIYLPLVRKSGSAKSKASVSMFNSDFQRIWETELYNNPNFGAASTGLITDSKGTIFVTGRTEVTGEKETMNNSFLAALTQAGTLKWKNYHEFTNTGTALLINNNQLWMLNKNCFVVDMVNPDDGSDAGKIRVFSSCDSKSTDAFGYDIDIIYNGNIIVSGEKGGGFYLALKSPAE